MYTPSYHNFIKWRPSTLDPVPRPGRPRNFVLTLIIPVRTCVKCKHYFCKGQVTLTNVLALLYDHACKRLNMVVVVVFGEVIAKNYQCMEKAISMKCVPFLKPSHLRNFQPLFPLLPSWWMVKGFSLFFQLPGLLSQFSCFLQGASLTSRKHWYPNNQ